MPATTLAQPGVVVAADTTSHADALGTRGGANTTKKKKKPTPTVNTALAKSNAEVVRLAVEADPLLRGWFKHSRHPGEGSVQWVVREEDLADRVAASKASHRFARIAGFATLCSKVPFARLMASLPTTPAWWPQTWVVPEQKIQASAYKEGPLIFKPDGSACGDGIAVCLREADMARALETTKAEQAVVQRYLQDPMLLDGLKFDLRLYLLVLGVGEAARAWLCSEGLVRVCSEPYAPADSSNKHKANSHLTNYSISKYEAAFSHADTPHDGSQGSKRALSATLQYLQRSAGVDPAAVWARLKELAGTVAGAMAMAAAGQVSAVPQAGLLEKFEGIEPAKLARAQQHGFHIIGVDVLLDSAGMPHLLELNNNPSMAIDSVFPREGPYVVPHPEMTEARRAVVAPAEPHVTRGYLHGKPCKCRQHHRPHDHLPCAVDIVAKQASVAGALAIMQRDKGSAGASAAELGRGTAYEPVLG